MPSELIHINSVEDLAQMRGWVIDDFIYDAEHMQIAIEIHNILAPNRVRITMQQSLSFTFGQPGIIQYVPLMMFHTEDIPNQVGEKES